MFLLSIYTNKEYLLQILWIHKQNIPGFRSGLEIRHFEKKLKEKKTQNSREKLNNSRVKLKDSTNFQTKKIWIWAKMILKLFLKKNHWIFLWKSKICWLNSIFCFNSHRISSKILDFSQKLKQKTQGFDKLRNAVWRKQVEFLSRY